MSGQSTIKTRLAALRAVSVRVCATIMALGMAVGLLFFARPNTSVVEKRALSDFPSWSMEAFLDGTFFSDLSLWYADTYPLREQLVSANQTLGRTFGIQPDVKLYGSGIAADEIGSNDTGSDDAGATEAPADNGGFEAVDAPEAKPMQQAVQEQLMAGLYVKDGAAYNIYYFVEDAATSYINAINTLAASLDGQADVYSILVPNGSAVLLDESELDQLGGSDQNQAIEYIFARYDQAVVPVDVRGALREHSDDYIFFRTDHHWTQLGAYIAYEQFCAEHGFEASDMESWETKEFDDFLGTFYSETGDTSLVEDTVVAYVPPQTNEMTFIDEDGQQYDSNVIVDVSGWGQGTGYYCYGIADYPLSHVTNPQKTDGSTCLLLKDSYGNSLAPQLIAHYQDLYVIDYRYSDTDIVQFAREHNVSDVVVENNISIASNEQVASTLLDQVTRSAPHDEAEDSGANASDAS